MQKRNFCGSRIFLLWNPRWQEGNSLWKLQCARLRAKHITYASHPWHPMGEGLISHAVQRRKLRLRKWSVSRSQGQRFTSFQSVWSSHCAEKQRPEKGRSWLLQRAGFRNLIAIHFLASTAGGIQDIKNKQTKCLLDLINYNLVIKLGSASFNRMCSHRHQRYRMEEKHKKSEWALFLVLSAMPSHPPVIRYLVPTRPL